MPKTGGVRVGAGRPKGVQNRDTSMAREAIARFIDGNAERLQGWLDKIAEENPLTAFNCVRDLLEYHIPKLARVEGEQKHDHTIIIKNAIKDLPNVSSADDNTPLQSA